MKKLVLAFALILSQSVVFAQSEKYTNAMTDLVTSIHGNIQGPLKEHANKMERIAMAEQKEWLPQYWVAYCLIQDAFSTNETAEKDMLLDKAEEYLVKAEALSPNNDEIEVLKAQYAMGKVSVDPMSRWQQYGQKFTETLQKAEKLNPNNPRIAYTTGINTFYTPEGFGGGKTNAKPLFEKSAKLFETAAPANALSPNWGKAANNYFLGLCN